MTTLVSRYAPVTTPLPLSGSPSAIMYPPTPKKKPKPRSCQKGGSTLGALSAPSALWPKPNGDAAMPGQLACRTESGEGVRGGRLRRVLF